MTQRQRERAAIELFGRVSPLELAARRLWRDACVLASILCAVAAGFGAYVTAGDVSASSTSGTVTDPSLHGRVVIRRDDRDIPHIAASSLPDAFFAQGFVEGSDRLFEMELTRRFAYGTLAEVFGARTLALDEAQRYYDIREIARRQWLRAREPERAYLTRFSDGVNAAMRLQPLPVEFRLLLYRPQPWRPEDSLAVSLAVSAALSDSWSDVVTRDNVRRRSGFPGLDALAPLSDARYDVDITGAPIRERGERIVPAIAAVGKWHAGRLRLGSNAWAAGAGRSSSGRALLANDPHLDLSIPGLWYLADVRAPGFHAAGAAIPGTPGILLGHNERVAWAATNADTAAMTLYEPRALRAAWWVRERFHVRFAKDVERSYYREPRAFAVPDDSLPQRLALVRWMPYERSEAPDAIATFLALDRARTAGQALHILSSYRGAAENFLVADARGYVAYHLAGNVPRDAAWGRYIHAKSDPLNVDVQIPYSDLPRAGPFRNGILVSANNRMYRDGYPYRLAAAFEPPYRAYRIAQLMHARALYDAAYFADMQLDTVSPVDREFAAAFAKRALSQSDPDVRLRAGALRSFLSWDGRFDPSSRTATAVHAARANLEEQSPSLYAVLAQLRARRYSAALDTGIREAVYGDSAQPAWGTAGAVPVDHPLAPMRFSFLNGPTLPGSGDEYTIHLQQDGFSQSFRAVWDVGNWDAGGIAIPAGESGQPGSGHYTDLTASWIAGRLHALPFSARAVEAATRERLTLAPR